MDNELIVLGLAAYCRFGSSTAEQYKGADYCEPCEADGAGVGGAAGVDPQRHPRPRVRQVGSCLGT